MNNIILRYLYLARKHVNLSSPSEIHQVITWMILTVCFQSELIFND